MDGWRPAWTSAGRREPRGTGASFATAGRTRPLTDAPTGAYVGRRVCRPRRTPDLGGIAADLPLGRRPRRYSCSPPMSENQTEPMDVFDTPELELSALAEPAVEVEAGRPSWEPDDGDFN